MPAGRAYLSDEVGARIAADREAGLRLRQIRDRLTDDGVSTLTDSKKWDPPWCAGLFWSEDDRSLAQAISLRSLRRARLDRLQSGRNPLRLRLERPHRADPVR
jgi:hypothetical protein